MDMESAMDMYYERAENAYTQALDEADELRRQRDEALQALRELCEYERPNGTRPAFFNARRILAQYEDGDA